MQDDKGTDLFLMIKEFLGLTEVNTTVTIVDTLIGIIGIIIAILSYLQYLKKQRTKKQKLKTQQGLLSTKSPFIAGPAVTPPQFVGRVQELKFLDSSLQNGESISLLGNRRIGKSSLLKTWEKSLISQKTHKVVFLDGQKREGKNLKSLLYAITQDGSINNNISADKAADQLIDWAEKQTLKYNNKPIILVDECEAIIQQCPHRFWERVRGALAHIIWVFSSKQPIDTLYHSYHNEGSPFENQLKTLWLGLLEKDACEKIIQKGDFKKPQQDLLREWAGCHPFYLQSLAGLLWLEKPLNETKITQALDRFKMASERHLNDLWKSLSAKEKDSLLNFIKNNQQPIDNSALRCKGVITTEGKPFARVFLAYLKDKQA